jgi:RecA/RadA recombinase
MVIPIDLAKLKRLHNKKHGVVDGFTDPITWIDTGNKALNRMISGDFNLGIPLGAVTVFAGESGSGKSYVVSGNIVRNALAMGATVIVADSEDALKKKWVSRLGVDPNHPALAKYVKNTVNQIVELINDMTETYRQTNLNVPREEQAKMLFVIDSLGFVDTDIAVAQFSKNNLAGDKGIKAKALKALVSNCIRLFAGYEIGLVATNHTYASQDPFNTDPVISGGAGFIFGSSIIVSMNKRKLRAEDAKDAADDKEVDASGKRKKAKAVVGITAGIKCVKTRYSKPFEEVQIAIPYASGMDPYSGLFEMFKSRGILVPDGSYYKFTNKTGKTTKLFRKDMDHAFFDSVIADFPSEDAERGFDLMPALNDDDEDASHD